MFKLFDDKSVLSAEPVLFRFEDKKIINYFRYYDIITKKETFNGELGEPIETRVLVCMVCGEYEHITTTLRKGKWKMLCDICRNEYKLKDTVKK